MIYDKRHSHPLAIKKAPEGAFNKRVLDDINANLQGLQPHPFYHHQLPLL